MRFEGCKIARTTKNIFIYLYALVFLGGKNYFKTKNIEINKRERELLNKMSNLLNCLVIIAILFSFASAQLLENEDETAFMGNIYIYIYPYSDKIKRH